MWIIGIYILTLVVQEVLAIFIKNLAIYNDGQNFLDYTVIANIRNEEHMEIHAVVVFSHFLPCLSDMVLILDGKYEDGKEALSVI